MKHVYYITYISSQDHDSCTVWCEASSPEEAADYCMSEYWDIESIVSIRRER